MSRLKNITEPGLTSMIDIRFSATLNEEELTTYKSFNNLACKREILKNVTSHEHKSQFIFCVKCFCRTSSLLSVTLVLKQLVFLVRF